MVFAGHCLDGRQTLITPDRLLLLRASAQTEHKGGQQWDPSGQWSTQLRSHFCYAPRGAARPESEKHRTLPCVASCGPGIDERVKAPCWLVDSLVVGRSASGQAVSPLQSRLGVLVDSKCVRPLDGCCRREEPPCPEGAVACCHLRKLVHGRISTALSWGATSRTRSWYDVSFLLLRSV